MEIGWGVIREYVDVLSRVGKKQAIYRGQYDSSWDLVPSIYRPGALGISHRNHLFDWQQRASRFASPIPADDVEWLVLAQHYGLPTALLDWTTSPLVALFFACDKVGNPAVEGAVWSIMQSSFEPARDTSMISVFGNGETRTKPFLINAVGRNVRSTAQDSLLSLHTSSDYHSLGAKKVFTIEPKRKRATLAALEKLGLTGERLHFDITLLVRRFKNEMRRRAVTISKN